MLSSHATACERTGRAGASFRKRGKLAVKDTSKSSSAAPALLAARGSKYVADVIAVLVIDRIAANTQKQAAEMVATRRQSAGSARAA